MFPPEVPLGLAEEAALPKLSHCHGDAAGAAAAGAGAPIGAAATGIAGADVT